VFIQARQYRRGRLKQTRLVVIHDMEAPEKTGTAEAVAQYLATTDRDASVHYCVDIDSTVQCVLETDTAFGAKGANADGLHIEHAGYAAQTRRDWTDAYSARMLARSAKLVADLCRRHSIPVKKLTPAQVRAGARGICGHFDVTAAFPPGSGHTDPGKGFPWPDYIAMVQAEFDALRGRTWSRSRVRTVVASLGVGAAALFALVTQTGDPTPAPAPAPKPTATATAHPTVTVTRPPTARTRVTVTKTTRVTATRTIRVTVVKTVAGTPRRYVIVRDGDTLYGLAGDLGTTVPVLRRLNPAVTPASLQVGDLIRYA
jgi:LysM repeat protein